MSTTRIELAPDSGYRLTVTAQQAGFIWVALRDYASWWRRNIGDEGEKRALEIEVLLIAIDPTRAELP